MAELIKGSMPALITPFDEKGNVKVELAGPIVDWYVSEGAPGLYMTGFTGEGQYMTVSQRKTWAEAVVKAAKGKTKVLVHVGYSRNLQDAVELAEHAGKIDAYAVSSVGISPESGLAENVAYFKKLSEVSGKPFYIYWNSIAGNLNGGKRIDAEDLLDAMKAVPTFAGLKYTDSNLYYVERMKKYMPDVNVLTGVDQMCVCGGLMGSDGAIGALQSVTCRHMRVMWETYKAGRIDDAMKLQLRADNIYQAIDDKGIQMIPAIKAIIERRYNIPVGYPSSLSTDKIITDQKKLDKLLKIYDENILK
jgi:N-acetylneuraminate lyase